MPYFLVLFTLCQAKMAANKRLVTMVIVGIKHACFLRGVVTKRES